MRKFILLPLSMLILTTSAAAAEGRTGADDTIRFIATPRTPNIVLTDKQLRQWESMSFPNMAAENPPKGKEAPPTYLETTATELKDPLKKVRVATCEAIGNGSFKISVSVDANGKILGIGASGSSGLEVSVECKK